MDSHETILRVVKLTFRQLRALIAENLENLPPRSAVETQLQDAKFDPAAGAKVLSMLDRRLPTSSKLLLQQLSRALQVWVSGKSGWNEVARALDRVYDAQVPRRVSSYSGMKAVRPSERPRSV